MPTISSIEFSNALTNGWDNKNMEISLPDGGTVGSNTKQYSPSLGLVRSGSQVLEGPQPTWEADTDFTITEVDFALEIGADYTSMLKYTTGDGPLDQGAGNGSSISVTDYGITMFEPGAAEILLHGKTNRDVRYRLLDGSDNQLASKSESTGPNFSVGAGLWQADSDLTFQNGGETSWTVGAIEVVVDGSGNRVLYDSISATVGAGGSITFSTLEISLTLP